ncbi:MAG TPA: acetylornithine deacetylase, partial [Flavisolibacter sp.]|nr:acetylornithine deacetylase [Flavisolibacter sp.]
MSNQDLNIIKKEAIELLKQLIVTPSYSREEQKTADLVQAFLKGMDVPSKRHLNNVFACNKFYSEDKPTILLNSHHDTVKPNKGYTL